MGLTYFKGSDIFIAKKMKILIYKCECAVVLQGGLLYESELFV